MAQDHHAGVIKAFLYASLFWLIIGTGVGVIAAAKMAYPHFLGEYGWLQFGRLRAVHTNAVLYGWLSLSFIAIMFYMAQDLLRTPLYSARLGYAAFALWNLAVALAALGFMKGSIGWHSLSKGKEFLEMNWLSTGIVLAAMFLVMINLFQTVARRAESQLYVTMWYSIGSVFWLPMVWIVGNAPVYTGVNDAIANWFLGHNVIGLWFTTAGVGMVYYLIPRTTRNPLYSHKLSLIGFWTIALVYPWVGAHHLIRGPVPEWLQTIAIIFSILMFVPVWTVITNFFKTMSGKWGVMAESVPLKFVIFGTWAYFLTCIQGPLQALRTVNQYTHLTNWTVGHAHLALFAAFSFISWGAIYYIFERATGRRISQGALAHWHFWVAAMGFAGFFATLTMAGLVQGAMWTQGLPFMVGVNAMFPYMLVRLVFGVAMFAAQVIFLVNVLTAKRVSMPVGRNAEPPEKTQP